MPYKTFNNWLFDRNIKSEIPKPKIDKYTNEEIIPDILKYNSPIHHTYILPMFVNYPKLNKYLDTYFNNINLRYLDKKEFFYFIKQCVIDFRVQRYNIPFIRKYYKRHKLFSILRKKIPILKDYEIFTLCDNIDRMEDKDDIYDSLGVKKIRKDILKKAKKTKKKKGKMTTAKFLKKYFVIEEVIHETNNHPPF